MHRVMISYASVQRPLAERLHAELATDHAPRIDALDLHPGDLWRRKLATWLAACDVAVVLVCERALQSDWVRHELTVLMHRVLHPDDRLHLIVQPVGVDRSTVRNQLGSSPNELDRLQMPDPIADAGAMDLNVEARRLADLVSGVEVRGTSPIDGLVQIVHEDIRKVERITDVVKARAKFDRTSLDPWKLRVIGDPRGDSEVDEVRRAFAHEFCAASIGSLFDPLFELAMPGEFDHGGLVDRSVQGGIDGVILDWFAGSAGTARAVVLAVESSDLVSLCPDGARHTRGLSRACTFVANQVVTADEPLQWVDGLARELDMALGVMAGAQSGSPRGISVERAERLAKERAVPVFVILTRPTGLTDRHLIAALDRWPDFRFIVLAGEDPAHVAECLGLPLVGVGAGAWSKVRDAEREMLDQRRKLRDDLAEAIR